MKLHQGPNITRVSLPEEPIIEHTSQQTNDPSCYKAGGAGALKSSL